MKTCRSCQVEQPHHCFYDNNTSCVSCHNTYNKIHQKDDIVFELTAEEKEQRPTQKRRRRDKHKTRVLSAKRRAAKLRATPIWLSTDQILQIEHIYMQALQLEQQTGVQHHVDHIVPIKGINVCGLHVPWNLKAIPAKENYLKSNKLIEELI